jgi:hypothetical protein
MSAPASPPDARCPRCQATYPWGTTVCPACHVALERREPPVRGECTVVVFESWDRPSVDTVACILQTHRIPSVVRGTADRWPFAGGAGGFWRVAVRPEDEPRAQSVLDQEIGRGEGGQEGARRA